MVVNMNTIWKIIILCIFLMCFYFSGYLYGSITEKMKIIKQNGISLSCWDFSDNPDKICKAFVTFENKTFYINSTFNEIKVLI